MRLLFIAKAISYFLIYIYVYIYIYTIIWKDAF